MDRYSTRHVAVVAALASIALVAAVWYLSDLRHARRLQVQPRAVATRGPLTNEESATIELFKKASPSVVYITTLTRGVSMWTRSVLEIPAGTGSGFFWDDGGHVVTNYHVIREADSARVTLADQTTYRAELVGVSPNHDLAVLRVSAPREKLAPLPVGTSHDLLVGQSVFAIGNPFGLDQTLTRGIISALGRSISSPTRTTIEDVIQTDAAINPGNSGGPLLDSAGRLVGVNTAIYSPSGAAAGIGFAVPVDTVNRVVPQIIARGAYRPPLLGVMVDDNMSRRVPARMGTEGLMILDVVEGSGAAEAGLEPLRQTDDGAIVPGDIIQAVEGQAVRTKSDLFQVLDRTKPGDRVRVTILRRGEAQEVSVRVQAPGG